MFDDEYVLGLIIFGIYILVVLINEIKNIIIKKLYQRKIVKEMTTEDFKEIKLLLKNIKGLKLYKIALIFIEFASCIFIIATYFVGRNLYDINSIMILLITLIIISIILIVEIRAKYKKEYKTTYKAQAIKALLEAINPNFEYSGEDGIGQSKYNSVVTEYYENFESKDMVTGNIKNHNFVISDVFTQKRETDSEKYIRYITVFKGCFALVEVNKSINSKIEILPKSGKSNIFIENEKFNKIFDVCSDNEILALRILTPDTVEKIVELCNKINKKMEITIKNDKIAFRFWSIDMFEPAISNDQKEIENMYVYKYLVNTMISLMEHIINTLEEVEL